MKYDKSNQMYYDHLRWSASMQKSFSLIKATKDSPNRDIFKIFYVAISSMRWCFYLIGMQKDQLPGVLGLTLIPSKRDRALRGLKALSVLSDLIGPRSE